MKAHAGLGKIDGKFGHKALLFLLKHARECIFPLLQKFSRANMIQTVANNLWQRAKGAPKPTDQSMSKSQPTGSKSMRKQDKSAQGNKAASTGKEANSKAATQPASQKRRKLSDVKPASSEAVSPVAPVSPQKGALSSPTGQASSVAQAKQPQAAQGRQEDTGAGQGSGGQKKGPISRAHGLVSKIKEPGPLQEVSTSGGKGRKRKMPEVKAEGKVEKKTPGKPLSPNGAARGRPKLSSGTAKSDVIPKTRYPPLESL